MKVPMLDLKLQYSTIREAVKNSVEDVMESQVFINGPLVEKFEIELADYCGTKYAVAVSSGTDALLMSLTAAGVADGDQVITSPFTFFATAGSIVRTGAIPVFSDIDSRTFNLGNSAYRSEIESKITSKTRAIMPVNLFGQMCDLDDLLLLTKKHNLTLIQDSCQSIGATIRGRKVNADLNCFSFFPSKNLGGFGDGGAIVTDHEHYYKLLKKLRNHGQTETYFYDTIGGNFRCDALQCAVLSIKLKLLDQWAKKRQQNAALYNVFFQNEGPRVLKPEIASFATSVYNQYTILVSNRDEVKEYLQKNDIGCAIYYPLPLHLQPCFRYLGYEKGNFSNAERVSDHCLSLPIYPELTNDQIEFVAKKVLEVAK